MIDRIRETVERASKVVDGPRRRAEELARDLARAPGKGPRASTPSNLAERVLDQARDYTRTARSLMTSEIRRQMRRMGLATSEEVERLQSRIAQLEAKAEASAARSRPQPRRRSSGELPSPEELAEKKVRRPSRAAGRTTEEGSSEASEGASRPAARRRTTSRAKPTV